MPHVRTLDVMGGIRTRDVYLTSHINTIRLEVSVFPMTPFVKPGARSTTLPICQMASHGDQACSTIDSEVSCANMIRPRRSPPFP